MEEMGWELEGEERRKLESCWAVRRGRVAIVRTGLDMVRWGNVIIAQ